MAEQEKYLPHGTHAGEIPHVFICNKEGKRLPVGDKDLRIGDDFGARIISMKVREDIEQPCVMGEIVFKDFGKFRCGYLFNDGYDYLQVEYRGNHDADNQKESDPQMFEIINVMAVEDGVLHGSAFDIVRLEIAQFPMYRNLLVWNISRGWKDKLISEIVKEIKTDYLDKNNRPCKCKSSCGETIEETRNKLQSFCSPHWNPLTLLKYLSNIAYNKNSYGSFFFYTDLHNTFHFKSLQSIITNARSDKLFFDSKQVRVITVEEALKDRQKIVKDFRPEVAHKEYYKTGLSGATIEAFDWFKKKNYTYKETYSNVMSANCLKEYNNLYEKQKDIDCYYGFFANTGFRYNKKDFDSLHAIVYNQIQTAISNQCKTQIVINGLQNIYCGKGVDIRNYHSYNENVEELDGLWLIRGITHSFTSETAPFRQTLDLCRLQNFYHNLQEG